MDKGWPMPPEPPHTQTLELPFFLPPNNPSACTTDCFSFESAMYAASPRAPPAAVTTLLRQAQAMPARAPGKAGTKLADRRCHSFATVRGQRANILPTKKMKAGGLRQKC